MEWVWVAAGAGLGGIARHWCSGAVARRIGETFPWGTLVVNVVGSWVIGLFAALTSAAGALGAAPATQQLVMIGICGGYTTFSSFALQTLALAREREWARAAANIVLSVALCLAAAWIGLRAGEALSPLP